eukprot:COSAG06_NODE_9917_length_1790_cov_1.788882_2_plen_81_part_00
MRVTVRVTAPLERFPLFYRGAKLSGAGGGGGGGGAVAQEKEAMAERDREGPELSGGGTIKIKRYLLVLQLYSQAIFQFTA